MTQPLHGRRILVTGGATGIGAAAVQVLSEASAAVVAAYAVMRKGGGGRIINFGSGEAVMGSPISAVYAATKGAVSAWTRSIARAWAGEKVSAIALAPAVQTPGADRLREFCGPEASKFIDEQIKATIPLGGALGDPVEDLGPTLVFLCSEGSRFITGQLIAVNGASDVGGLAAAPQDALESARVASDNPPLGRMPGKASSTLAQPIT
jgi:NAD(P)-dependent dehydrogenase (short-subunit alcohol dehydrogenase family)